jgi:hypothetical protein
VAIDAALLAGERQAAVAARFKISPDSAFRHAKAHLNGALVAGTVAEAARASDAPGDGLATLLATQRKLIQVVDQRMRHRQTTTMIAATRELRATIEAIARLTGATGASGALRREGPSGNSVEVIRARILEKLRAIAGDDIPKPPTPSIVDGTE